MEKTHSRLWLLLPHALFVVTVLVTLLVPDRDLAAAAVPLSKSLASSPGSLNHLPFIAVLVVVELFALLRLKQLARADITAIILAFLLLWELATVKMPGQPNLLYPAPEQVLAVFFNGWPLIVRGLESSGLILGVSYGLTLVLAIPLGIALGLSTRLRPVLLTFIRIITPIPPLVYSPYAIVMMPSFWHASVFIVFMSIFWLVFLSMTYTVAGMEQQIVTQARTLNVSRGQFFFHVLIPYCLPQIFNVISLSLTAAFTVLIVAEMFGGVSGVGWYTRYHANFAEYTKVVTGIIVMALSVTLLNNAIKLVRWLAIKWER